MKASEKRMCVDHADRIYVEWKKQLMVELGIATETSNIKEVTRTRWPKANFRFSERVHEVTTGANATGETKRSQTKPNQITTKSYRFETRSLYEEWHKPFYVQKQMQDPTYNPKGRSQRRKRFPCELVFWFNHPFALAVFYMDDGGVQNNQPYFATGEVPEKEVKLMQLVFKRNFSLETTIRYSKGTAVGLLVKRKDCKKFIQLVQLYVSQVASMTYKLNIT